MNGTDSLNLFELTLLIEASRAKSLRGLARERRLKPAHLSKSLKKLERKLQRQLFHRSTSGIELTADGARLLPLAEEILTRAQGLTGQGAATRAREKVLGIVAVNFIQTQLVIPSLAEIAKAPRFRLVEIFPEDLLAHAIKNDFEIAIHMNCLPWPRPWSTKKMGRIPFGLFARTTHPLSETVTEAEALEYPFIIPTYLSEGRFRPGFDYCPVSVVQRKWALETATAGLAAQALLHADHLAFLPEVVVRPLIKSGQIRALTVKGWPAVEREVFMTVHEERVPEKLRRQLADNIKRLL